MTHISPGGELPNTIQVSPLILSDTLLTLAQRADRAGYRSAARRLLRLALSVLNERPVPRSRGGSRSYEGSISTAR